MNVPAMTQMLVSMRAQIDALLSTIQGEQPEPENSAPKCPKCGCEKLYQVKAGGKGITVCDDCGLNFSNGALWRTLGPSDHTAVREVDRTG